MSDIVHFTQNLLSRPVRTACGLGIGKKKWKEFVATVWLEDVDCKRCLEALKQGSVKGDSNG